MFEESYVRNRRYRRVDLISLRSLNLMSDLAQEFQASPVTEHEPHSMQKKVAAKRNGQASRGRHITQRRSKQERLIDIIRVVAANGQLRRTHILYKANLTWGELREDLDALEKVGAIKMMESGEGTFYGSTEVGLELLTHSSRILTILTGNASNM